MKNSEAISSTFKQEPTDDNSSLQPPSSLSSVNQSCHNQIIHNNNIYLNDQHSNLTTYPYLNAVTIDTFNKTNSMLSMTDEKLIPPTSEAIITTTNNLITKKFQNPFINFNLTNQFSYPLSSLPIPSASSSSHQTSDNIQFVNTTLQDMNYSTSTASTLIPASSIFDSSQSSAITASTPIINNLNINTTDLLQNQRLNISRNSLKSGLLNSVTRTSSQSSTSSSTVTRHHTSKVPIATGVSTSTTVTPSTQNRLAGSQECGTPLRSNVQNHHSPPFNSPPLISPPHKPAPPSQSHHHHHHRHHHHLHHYRSTSICSRASYMCRKCKTHGHNIPVKRHKRTCPYTNCTCIKCHLVDQGRKVVARQIALYRDQKGNSHHRDIHDRLDVHRIQSTSNGNWQSPSTSSVSSNRTTNTSTLTTTTSKTLTTPVNTNLEINKTDEIKINKNLNNNRSNNNNLSNHGGVHTTVNDSSNSNNNNSSKTNSLLIPLSHSNSLRSMVALIDEKQTITTGPHCRRCRNHSIAVTWKGHKKTCPFRNCPCDPCRLINVRKDTEKTLREMVSHSEMKPFTGVFKENRSNYSAYTPRLATETNSIVSEANNRFEYIQKSIHSNYSNGNQPVEQQFINQQIQESVLLRPPNSSTCLTQLLHNNTNNNVSSNNSNSNNVAMNSSHSQFNQKINSRPNSIDSVHSQNSSDIHSNNSSIPLSNLSNPSNVNSHLKLNLKSAKVSNLSPYRELTHLSSSDWWIQSTSTSTQSLANSSVTFVPPNLTLPINSLQNQNHLIADYMQSDTITLESMNQKINNNSTVEYGSTITSTTTDISQLSSSEDYYQQSIMKNDLTIDNNSDFICNDISNNNNNNNKNYYNDNIDYIGCVSDFRNPPTYTPRTNRCQGNNPTVMMMTNHNTTNVGSTTTSTSTTVNGNSYINNNNSNKFASCFNPQLSNETAFYCPERVSAVAAAAAAAAAMVAMTPGISNSPRHCSHHHYHHHHCHAHTHCYINQNCRGDVQPPPPPPPPPPQRHEEDNMTGIDDIDDDGEGIEEDYDDEEDDELGSEDSKRHYHYYHHLMNQPISSQHHQNQHQHHQQHHKSYDITDPLGSYTNLEQNKTIRGYFPFDTIHTPPGSKTNIASGETLTYIDDYHNPSIEYYSKLNKSPPKDWKINKDIDNIRSCQQQELSTLVQFTGNNNNKKYDLRFTGTLPTISTSTTIHGVSVPATYLTTENIRDSSLNTISLSPLSDCIPTEIQTNLTSSLSLLPTNISASFSLDYLNPVWRNQSNNNKMSQSISDMSAQINEDDCDDNDNSDDNDNPTKQVHSRLSINQIQNSNFEFSKQITIRSDNDHDDDGDGDENRSIWSLSTTGESQCNNNNIQILPTNQSNLLTMNSINFESTGGVRDSSLLMRG